MKSSSSQKERGSALDVLDASIEKDPLGAVTRSLQLACQATGQVRNRSLLALAGALMRKNKFPGIASDLAALVRASPENPMELFVALSVLRSVRDIDPPTAGSKQLDVEWRRVARRHGFDALVHHAEAIEKQTKARSKPKKRE